MKLNILKLDGSKSSQIKADESVFGIKPNEPVIRQAVLAELTNLRQGTHATKNRASVAGGGRKPWRQKGRGVARAGTIRSPLWRGGGRVFGPRPRSYDQKVNKKVKRLARKSALSYKAKSKAIMIIEDFDFSKPNTKGYLSILSALDLQAKKTLMVLNGGNKNIYLSSRNLKNSNVVVSTELNTYEITDATNVLILESAVDGLESNLK